MVRRRAIYQSLPAKSVNHSAVVALICFAGNRSFYFHFGAHPGMNAALKMMYAFRQTDDLKLAALKDSGPGHCNVCKAAGAFGNHGFARCIKRRYKAAAELRDFGKRVRFAALIEYIQTGSFLDFKCIWFEVPARIRSSSRSLCE